MYPVLIVCFVADIDECLVNRGGCGTNCTDTNGSHVCSCTPGFVLQSDAKTCAGMVDSS